MGINLICVFRSLSRFVGLLLLGFIWLLYDWVLLGCFAGLEVLMCVVCFSGLGLVCFLISVFLGGWVLALLCLVASGFGLNFAFGFWWRVDII